MIASPITGLVRGLNALITGLAIQLGQIRDQGLVGGDARPRRRLRRRGGPRRRLRPAAEEAPAEEPRRRPRAEEAPAEEAPPPRRLRLRRLAAEEAPELEAEPRVTGLRLMKLMRPPRATRRNKEGPWPLLQS